MRTIFPKLQVPGTSPVSGQADGRIQIIYANNNSMPFLALGGAHGSITSLEGFQNGIGIRLSKLKNITVSDDGTYATIEGGVTNGEVMRALKAVNKQSGMSARKSPCGPYSSLTPSKLLVSANAQASWEHCWAAATDSYKVSKPSNLASSRA